MVALPPVTLFVINSLHQPPGRRYHLQTDGWIPHWDSYCICLLPPTAVRTQCHVNIHHHRCTHSRSGKPTQHLNKAKYTRKRVCSRFFGLFLDFPLYISENTRKALFKSPKWKYSFTKGCPKNTEPETWFLISFSTLCPESLSGISRRQQLLCCSQRILTILIPM